ncbi:hypothetical protein EVC45_44215 [Paraburkholderia sp. UYCP14C]|nr:hypothetical protein EVC45_44215 [Paraburkholderia sp. UYCP14C]
MRHGGAGCTVQAVLLDILDLIGRGIGGQIIPSPRGCHSTQFRQRALALRVAAPIDDFGYFLRGNVGIEQHVVCIEQVVCDSG